MERTETAFNWPWEMRLAAIRFELPGGPKGADIFVAEDPPGEFDDECLYVPKEQLEATRQQLDRLLADAKALKDQLPLAFLETVQKVEAEREADDHA